MKTQKTNVVSLPATENDNKPIYEMCPFPSPETGDRLSIEEFLKIPPIPVNRDEVARARKVTALLTTPMYKHNEVDLMTYTGPTVNKPAFFQHGRTYVMDGNTRKYIWSKYMDGQLANNKISFLKIPEEVIVNRYEFDDAFTAIATYYTIDSVESYEKAPEKVTGVFRALNMSQLENKKIKSGTVSVALNTSCPYGKGNIYQVPIVDDLFTQVAVMKEVITALDKLDAAGKGVLSHQVSLGVAMLAGKIMGPDDPDWISAIELLVSEDSYKQRAVDLEDDGIDYLWLGRKTNPIGVDMENALPYKMGQSNDRTGVLNYLAYCWSQLIDGNNIPTCFAKKDITNSYSKLLQRCWEENEDD